VKLSARGALTEVIVRLCKLRRDSIFIIIKKCKLSIGVMQVVHRPSKVSEFANLRNC
jgi:hypothetical protein